MGGELCRHRSHLSFMNFIVGRYKYYQARDWLRRKWTRVHLLYVGPWFSDAICFCILWSLWELWHTSINMRGKTGFIMALEFFYIVILPYVSNLRQWPCWSIGTAISFSIAILNMIDHSQTGRWDAAANFWKLFLYIGSSRIILIRRSSMS